MSATTLPATSRTEAAVGVWHLRWRRFLHHRPGVIALVVLALLIAFALAAFPLEWFGGFDPDETDLFSRFGPSTAEHLLGTDEAGRDELIRLMVGGQISLLVGLLATACGGAIGLLVGVTSGYFGGKVDALLMRFTDGMITLPLLPLLIVLGAVDLTKLGFSAEFAHSGAAGFWRIVIIISLVDWTSTARIVRAATLSVRERDFVRAARASGARSGYVMGTHVLPNVATPIIVALTLTVGRVILFESVLSFLGFGIVPPTPSWGNMLNNAQELVTTAPALAVYPGVFIFLTVIAVNFLGDGLQHAFDPRSER
ncbi:MAG: ABC transporter permease [Nevskia sp.]|nr:ABC transporter permease [Nevskia sp.]